MIGLTFESGGSVWLPESERCGASTTYWKRRSPILAVAERDQGRVTVSRRRAITSRSIHGCVSGSMSDGVTGLPNMRRSAPGEELHVGDVSTRADRTPVPGGRSSKLARLRMFGTLASTRTGASADSGERPPRVVQVLEHVDNSTVPTAAPRCFECFVDARATS
jgi:hypothetical protein